MCFDHLVWSGRGAAAVPATALSTILVFLYKIVHRFIIIVGRNLGAGRGMGKPCRSSNPLSPPHPPPHLMHPLKPTVKSFEMWVYDTDKLTPLREGVCRNPGFMSSLAGH
ncbi:hypothetical protein RRG08_010405 [Elysia crispata]|uniref:Uncharacterized protein n=1 Tax=Elysia crispata TaxID=231223 RepID=A0AAE1ECK4_9GAST|nr:hypothetical protein RRG08_010405 [Elysia crispata]